MIMDIDDFQIDFKKESSRQSIKDILDIPITILNVKVSKSKFFNKENRSKKYLEINYKIKGSQDDLIRKVCTNSNTLLLIPVKYWRRRIEIASKDSRSTFLS